MIYSELQKDWRLQTEEQPAGFSVRSELCEYVSYPVFDLLEKTTVDPHAWPAVKVRPCGDASLIVSLGIEIPSGLYVEVINYKVDFSNAGMIVQDLAACMARGAFDRF